MDVRCPQCETLYELDSTQLKSKVVTLKCSQCQHVFRFETRSDVVQENQRRWMVRNLKSGDVLYLNSFETLHKWIMEGKVTRDDEISRTGKKWTLLGDIGEFMPVFQVVASISSIASENAPSPEAATPVDASGELPPSPHAEAEAEAEAERERIKTSIQYGGTPARTEEVTKRARPERPRSSTPAGAQRPEPTPAPQSEPPREREPSGPAATQDAAMASHLGEDSHWELGTGVAPETPSEPVELPASSSSKWPLVVVVLLALAGGGYYYVSTYQPEWMSTVLEQKPDREVVSIGKTDAGADAPVAESADPSESIASAYGAAFAAQSEREAQLFANVVKATRPATDQALGVATEEAEAWAEGGAVDDLLAQARRNLESGRQSRALSLYEDVLKHEKSNVIAITGIGWVYVEQSRSADAVRQFKRALDLNSDYGDAYIGLGTAERQRGNLKAAYDAYDLYLGRHPKGQKASIARYQMQQLKQQLGL